MRGFNLTRPVAAGIGLLALMTAVCAVAAGAQSGEKTITCTNPANGATWQIKIDYDHVTVDSHPATIGDAEISWHTADGENYKLDRKSGNLTVIVASSTGGYFLFHRCTLDNQK